MTASNIYLGQKFADLPVEDFQRINKEANQGNLMANITKMENTEDGRRLSFEIVARKLH